MLSRVASPLFWLSRYLERAENMARILDVGQSLALLSGRPGEGESTAIEPLVITDTVQALVCACGAAVIAAAGDDAGATAGLTAPAGRGSSAVAIMTNAATRRG